MLIKYLANGDRVLAMQPLGCYSSEVALVYRKKGGYATYQVMGGNVPFWPKIFNSGNPTRDWQEVTENFKERSRASSRELNNWLADTCPDIDCVPIAELVQLADGNDTPLSLVTCAMLKLEWFRLTGLRREDVKLRLSCLHVFLEPHLRWRERRVRNDESSKLGKAGA